MANGHFTFKYCCGYVFSKTFKKIMSTLRRRGLNILGQEREIHEPTKDQCRHCGARENTYEMTILYRS